MTALLSIDQLGKRFRARWALRDASFDVRAGEILGVIGPNGSGKTTLFSCIAGIIPATAGVVRAAERVLSEDERKQALFFVPDGVRPWSGQTVSWAIDFVARAFGVAADVRARVVSRLSLDGLRTARMKSLSKGEHKRVMLALGLLSSPPVLLLDEPFDGLDFRQTRDVIGILREYAAAGRTLVLSIHQLSDAARVCDRLILLSGGAIVGTGTLDELRQQANVQSGGLEEVFLALT